MTVGGSVADSIFQNVDEKLAQLDFVAIHRQFFFGIYREFYPFILSKDFDVSGEAGNQLLQVDALKIKLFFTGIAARQKEQFADDR